MKKENLMDVLSGIDHDLIEEAERYPKRRKIGLWTKIGALAASVAVAVSLGLLLWKENAPPLVAVHDPYKLTGVQELSIGDRDDNISKEKELRIAPHFPLHMVIEAEVMEILPDVYRPCEGREVHVLKLKVLDAIRGEGLPKEIYFCYPYYDTTLFEGYDRLILSIRQLGLENYMLLNITQKQGEFFPNMFEDATFDPGYGSVIAFRDGVVDAGFWERANRRNMPDYYMERMLENPDEYGYPAAYGDSPQDVKARISKLVIQEDIPKRYDYLTAEDFFSTAESKANRAYLSPDSGNWFAHTIQWAGDGMWGLEYTRTVNGFLTDEVITVYPNGKIKKKGTPYSPEDIVKLPDLGAELEKLDLSALSPPHIDPTEEARLVYAQANGFYRKAGDEVYGIIRVKWRYRPNSGGNMLLEDDYYCIYDAYGNRQVMERDQLKSIIGNDPLIEYFAYKWQMYK